MTNTHLKNLGISILDQTPTDLEMEDLTPQQLEDVVKKLTKPKGMNTGLEMREFLGIDKALTRKTGELKNNGSKMTEIDEHLEREHKRLDEIGDGDIRDRIKKRIADLKEERAAKLEITTQNHKELSSQFLRIRQTIEKILDGNLTLREKVKLIFREQGITITVVLTAFGLKISTIITSLTGGAEGSSTPPEKPKKLKEWFKNKLTAPARLLS